MNEDSIDYQIGRAQGLKEAADMLIKNGGSDIVCRMILDEAGLASSSARVMLDAMREELG